MSSSVRVQGDTPLVGVDATHMHAAVDALATVLHQYVDAAVGTRAEFEAAVADADPRILALEARVGRRNAALFDVIHSHLQMHPELTRLAWDGEARTADPEGSPAEEAEAFYLAFEIARPPAGVSMTLDGVITLLDDAGHCVVSRLADGGYEVLQWAAAGGMAPGFGHEDDDNDGTGVMTQ